jgi:hypothetical protein
MRCSKCKETGHSARSCNLTQGSVKKLRTEDTGIIFEMAITLAKNITYNGKYKYGMEAPEKLKPRLTAIVDDIPEQHTAMRGGRYDFTSLDGTQHLSAKTTKGDGKVAPQVVGQPQPKKLCNILGIEYTTNDALKQYIQTNPQAILPVLVEYTFDCPTLYYNQKKDTIRHIVLHTPIDWTTYPYAWTCTWEDWKNSSTLKVVIEHKEYPLLEVQFHSKSRSNMAIRWHYENFLAIFKDHLTIRDL